VDWVVVSTGFVGLAVAALATVSVVRGAPPGRRWLAAALAAATAAATLAFLVLFGDRLVR